jgi:hypothetical protein
VVDYRKGLATRVQKAGEFRESVLPTIDQIKAEGITSAKGIARALNERSIKTRRGGEWTGVQVARVLSA